MNLSDMGANSARIAGGKDLINSATEKFTTHICVCVCTYRRPLPLKRLLLELNRQETGDSFTYSIVVVDNDEEGVSVVLWEGGQQLLLA